MRPETLAPRGRLDHLDNLRVHLTFLVVAHHVALVYSNIPAWPNWEQPADPGPALPLDLFVLLNQAFFMGLFFLLSGYLTPASVDRKGSRTFALDRLKRLGIPFLVFVVLLRPMYTLPTYLRSPAAERPPYWQFYLTESDIGPMWFLEVLLLLSLAYAWWRARRPHGPPEPPAGSTTTAPLRAWHVLAFATGLAVASYLWRMLVPMGAYIPIVGLPSGAYLPQYVALFVVGALALRRRWVTSSSARAGWLGLGFMALSLVPLALGGHRALDPSAVSGVTDVAHLGFAFWDSLFACGAILILLALFGRFASRSNAFTRYASANAFGVYVLHAPIIVLVAWVFSTIQAEPVIKFLVALPLSATLSWGLSSLLRRIPAVRGVL